MHAVLSKALMKTPLQGAEAVLAVILGAVCSQQRKVQAVPGEFHADGMCGPAAAIATHPAVMLVLETNTKEAIGHWWDSQGRARCDDTVLAAVASLLDTWRHVRM